MKLKKLGRNEFLMVFIRVFNKFIVNDWDRMYLLIVNWKWILCLKDGVFLVLIDFGVCYFVSGINKEKFFVFLVVCIVRILKVFFVCRLKGSVLYLLLMEILIYDLLCLFRDELE